MTPCLLLLSGLLVCGPGTLGHAPLMDAVAARRWNARHEWGGLRDDPARFEALVAVDDCRWLGWSGWLLVGGGRAVSALVVDCQQEGHRREGKYLADLNLDLVGEGALLLRKPDGRWTRRAGEGRG